MRTEFDQNLAGLCKALTAFGVEHRRESAPPAADDNRYVAPEAIQKGE